MAPSKINVKDRLSEDGEIDLSMSEIQDVPVKEIIAFKKAYSLDLSNNNISKLPNVFSTLTHITKLDLSKNLLKELPENFGDLVRLRHLDLYQNQLEHLPLSFSKLKALKWLDLKDNPLVPAVAKVAGLCVDSKQCQICAKNVVSFFTNLQNKVDTEKEMREKHRKKQLEVNQQKLKEEKKSKKKEKVKAHIENGVNKEVGTKNIEVNKSIKQKKNKEKPVEVVRKSRLLNLLFYVAFVGSLLFVLTSVKSKRYAKVEFQVVNVYSKILEALPQNLRSYGVQGGEVFKNVHEKTGQGILHVYDYLNNDPQIKYLHSWIVDTCKVFLLKIETFYKNTFK